MGQCEFAKHRLCLQAFDWSAVHDNEVRDNTKYSPFKRMPKHGERLVGLPDKRRASVNLQNTVFAFKRLIG
jgi:molecular chaperone DnaK (HSP70)